MKPITMTAEEEAEMRRDTAKMMLRGGFSPAVYTSCAFREIDALRAALALRRGPEEDATALDECRRLRKVQEAADRLRAAVSCGTGSPSQVAQAAYDYDAARGTP